MTTDSATPVALDSFDLSPFATGEPLPSPAAERTAAAIDDVLQSTGFLLVDGHGVSDEVRTALCNGAVALANGGPHVIPFKGKERYGSAAVLCKRSPSRTSPSGHSAPAWPASAGFALWRPEGTHTRR